MLLKLRCSTGLIFCDAIGAESQMTKDMSCYHAEPVFQGRHHNCISRMNFLFGVMCLCPPHGKI
ncbi:hypothetical protein HZS_484 [Henneguya salminicola]|nr:hypothetical protein HZS_484 [Henneguya salminicola]